MDVALISSIGAVLLYVIQFIQIIIIIHIVLSWVSPDPNNQIVQVLYSLSEPIIRPFRRLTANLPGPIDWGPMALLLLLFFLRVFITKLLVQYGMG